MCKVFLTVFVFGLAFHCGNAKFECPVPPKSSLIYFDLEALNLLALQQGYHNTIHSPLLCVKGLNEECKGQQCCPGEEGCCLRDRLEEKHIRKCGCMKSVDKLCKFPAPYAILANSECSSDGKMKISACLREKREEDYLAKQVASKVKNNFDGQLRDPLDDLYEIVVDVISTSPILSDPTGDSTLPFNDVIDLTKNTWLSEHLTCISKAK